MRLRRKQVEALRPAPPPPVVLKAVVDGRDETITTLQLEVASLRQQLAEAKIKTPVAPKAAPVYEFTFERDQRGFVRKVIATPTGA